MRSAAEVRPPTAAAGRPGARSAGCLRRLAARPAPQGGSALARAWTWTRPAPVCRAAALTGYPPWMDHPVDAAADATPLPELTDALIDAALERARRAVCG